MEGVEGDKGGSEGFGEASVSSWFLAEDIGVVFEGLVAAGYYVVSFGMSKDTDEATLTYRKKPNSFGKGGKFNILKSTAPPK